MSRREKVVLELQRRISTGELPVGQRLPSERDLAESLGASRGVVHAAVADLEALGYVLRQANCRTMVLQGRAKHERQSGHSRNQVAVWILPDMQDLGGLLILQGIRTVFGAGNYRLLIGCPPSHDRETIQRAEFEFFESLAGNKDIAGAIVWDTGNLAYRKPLEALVAAGMPVVFIDREPLFPIEADVVATNNRRAARNAVRHLIDLGHQRIAMVVGDDRASSVQDRIEGYRLALREADINPHDEWLIDLRPHDGMTEEAVAEAFLTDMMRSAEPPTAMFAVNDRLALHVYDAARTLHIPIPEKFSLVGFDWLMRLLPSGGDLTTVSQPFDEIGATAAQRLLHRIGVGAGEASRQILFDAPLIVKRTTSAVTANSSSHRLSETVGEIYATTQ